jgi:hypothetical protein
VRALGVDRARIRLQLAIKLCRAAAVPRGLYSLECRVLAPSTSSRRCSDMAAVGGTPNSQWTWPIPPLVTHLRHSLV